MMSATIEYIFTVVDHDLSNLNILNTFVPVVLKTEITTLFLNRPQRVKLFILALFEEVRITQHMFCEERGKLALVAQRPGHDTRPPGGSVIADAVFANLPPSSCLLFTIFFDIRHGRVVAVCHHNANFLAFIIPADPAVTPLIAL